MPLEEPPATLKARWLSPEGVLQTVAVLEALQRHRDLRGRNFLTEHLGRVDLRGFAFPSVKTKGQLSFHGSEIQIVEGKPSFKKLSLSQIDLSFADLRDSIWEECSFTNARLVKADLTGSGFWACKFSDIDFRESKLRSVCLGGNIGRNTSTFDRVDFSRSDLRESVHGFASYSHCTFVDCKLFEVAFNGARFSDCQFAGMLDSVSFRDYAKSSRPPTLFGRTELSEFKNSMKNIDFSSAVLRDVLFQGVDLSTCSFPQDGMHVVVYNQNRVFQKVYSLIYESWNESEEKKITLRLIDVLFLSPDAIPGSYLNKKMIQQPIQVINKTDFEENFGIGVGNKMFALVQEVNERLKV